MTDSNLNDLCEVLQPIAREFLFRCNKLFVTKIIVTWRDADAQGAAYDQGLSHAKAGESPHNCCLADGTPAARGFDFAIFFNGAYITDGTDSRYEQAGQIAKDLGLAWGGSWHNPDYDHVEISNWREV